MQPTRITHKNIWYFPTFAAARSHATIHRLPTDRIIYYGRGWAIQYRAGGPYVGPYDSVKGA
jgi:hypothetical protein